MSNDENRHYNPELDPLHAASPSGRKDVAFWLGVFGLELLFTAAITAFVTMQFGWIAGVGAFVLLISLCLASISIM
ncbi:hypothetical protein [Parvularcula sp. IMCC14364]|uniref:hypothetical protein n=1 Tax=Parvularcula sp. IMCC14364 TaxID=3067902 RepID=UPI00274189EB|nr:hypothetical protein [Parvularcula sp. IMCC14364]